MRVEGEMVMVGSMNRSRRIVLVAGLLLVSVNAVHAGLWRRKAPKQAETTQVAAMALTTVEVDGSRIHLRTTGTPAYTSYSPAPDVFVVDLTGTTRDAALVIPATLPPAVASIAADDVVEMGNRLTRITVRFNHPLTPEATAEEKAVTITVPATAVAIQDALPAVQPIAQPLAAPVVSEPIVAEPKVEVVSDLSNEPVAKPASGSLRAAKTVKRVEANNSGGAVEVVITGDGALKYNAFRLENPSRLVVDLDGVKNTVAKSNVTVADANVKGVRVGQFKTAPMVARVVIDLAQKMEYDIAPDGERLRIVFGHGAVAQKTSEPDAMTSTVAEVPAPAPAPVVIAEKPAPQPVTHQPVATIASNDIPSQVPTIAENATTWKVPEPASKGARPVINAPAPQTPPTTQPTTTQPQEDVFAEASPMRQNASAAAQTLSGTRTLSSGPRQFNGEPISLNLKEADIKDVLKTFADLTGLNIAIDPGVSGSVTVDFVDVPWDQALDLILRQNNLTWITEGNVMRIGTIDRLTAETSARRRLDEEERLNKPLTTLIFKLSYARAADVSSLLRDIASPRARIIVENRTNQLIISEIPEYLTTIQNLLTTVDIPNKQVAIEARIVESSRTFNQAYGFSYGFSGVLDPALGTGTGLVFPNRVGYTGGPFSFTGGAPSIIGLTLTDVLGTFSLDFALHAAESQGYIKVISAPRVVTQDNSAASIQSGFQIPYQTRVNFTTTVQYLDATLQLTVTPQITEAGTVIMDITVQKNEPAVGLSIEGAAGTPITTRQAHTKLMVRDGGTAVIAGIFQTKDNNAQTRLPFVHQIPVIGNLFKSHSIVTSHDELLIFITPRIVKG